MPCKAQPSSPASSCPDHPALQHAKLLPGALTAPCSFTPGPWNKAVLPTRLSFLLFLPERFLFTLQTQLESHCLWKGSLPFSSMLLEHICHTFVVITYKPVVSRFMLYTLQDKDFARLTLYPQQWTWLSSAKDIYNAPVYHGSSSCTRHIALCYSFIILPKY